MPTAHQKIFTTKSLDAGRAGASPVIGKMNFGLSSLDVIFYVALSGMANLLALLSELFKFFKSQDLYMVLPLSIFLGLECYSAQRRQGRRLFIQYSFKSFALLAIFLASS